jgi:parvulin-like peptidyl-prolyl isomerase
MIQNKWDAFLVFTGIVALAMVVIFAATQGSPSETTTDEQVLATVNDEPVYQSDLPNAPQLNQSAALEQAITVEVLRQEAVDAGYTLSREEAEQEITTQLERQNLTMEDYKQRLQQQGVTYESQISRVQEQLAIQQYLQASLDGQLGNVTDEQTRQYYDQYARQTDQEIPPYRQLEPQIRQQLQQQQRQRAIQSLAQQLRQDATIEYR